MALHGSTAGKRDPNEIISSHHMFGLAWKVLQVLIQIWFRFYYLYWFQNDIEQCRTVVLIPFETASTTTTLGTMLGKQVLRYPLTHFCIFCLMKIIVVLM